MKISTAGFFIIGAILGIVAGYIINRVRQNQQNSDAGRLRSNVGVVNQSGTPSLVVIGGLGGGGGRRNPPKEEDPAPPPLPGAG